MHTIFKVYLITPVSATFLTLPGAVCGDDHGEELEQTHERCVISNSGTKWPKIQNAIIGKLKKNKIYYIKSHSSSH